MNKKKIVIVGATSAIAEHCARIWVQKSPADLTLVGRNANKTERIAADLRVRSPQSEIRVEVTDFLDPVSIKATVDRIFLNGYTDFVLIAHGLLPNQTDCQNDLAICREALEVNGISPVIFSEAFLQHMATQDKGTLALIGSVAGDRGRKSNYVYGAAKALVNRYAQGLQHRFSGTGIKIVLIKPGPTKTPMTAHLTNAGVRLAPVQEVAEKIVNAIKNGQPEAYIPRKWRLIMLIIQHLPRFIFNKINI